MSELALGDSVDAKVQRDSDRSRTPARAPAGTGDNAILRLTENDADASSDLNWWTSRPALERFNTIVALLGLLLTILGQLTTEGFSDAQVGELLQTSHATEKALLELVELERQSAAQHAEAQRFDGYILEQLASINERLAGRPCQVVVNTSLRGFGPGGKIMLRLESGRLATCLNTHGKWLEVVVHGPDGEVRGWVLKKHLRWE